jgi:FkbM family methyltransferase
MNQNYQEYLAWTYFSEQALDRAEYPRFEAIVRGTRRFIDVGASHGIYTYLANQALENAEIIAIEADPERFAILQKNAAKWQSESSNTIRCINAAASDELDRGKSPEITFYTTGTQISGGLFSVIERSDDYAPTRIPLICVDDFFEPGVKTFIKIDVEGSELRVLKGAMRHMESGDAKFFTEISWWGDRDRRTNALDVLRFFYHAGMRIDRRLRSDYLAAPESSKAARIFSALRCIPPLLVRVTYNTLVPRSVRLWRERRENGKRLARYARAQPN